MTMRADDRCLKALASLAETSEWRDIVAPWLQEELAAKDKALREEPDAVYVRWRQAEARMLRELLDSFESARDVIKGRKAAHGPDAGPGGL